MLMDVASGSTANGGEVIQWQSNGGDNQEWKLNRVADNVYTLVSVKSGLCLDVPSRSTAQNVQLQQWTCNGGANQQFAADLVGSFIAAALLPRLAAVAEPGSAPPPASAPTHHASGMSYGTTPNGSPPQDHFFNHSRHDESGDLATDVGRAGSTPAAAGLARQLGLRTVFGAGASCRPDLRSRRSGECRKCPALPLAISGGWAELGGGACSGVRYDHGMVTAWSPWRVDGTRLGGRPLLRVLAMAALLFGVLMAHCGHMESADGHSGGVTVSAAQPEDAASHSGEECMSGQPQQASVPAAPCFAAWVRQATGVEGASPLRPPAIGRSVDGVSPVALRAASVVRQV